jgi:hypothetical protein
LDLGGYCQPSPIFSFGKKQEVIMARKMPLSPEWPGSDRQPFHLSQIESFLDLDGVLIMLKIRK